MSVSHNNSGKGATHANLDPCNTVQKTLDGMAYFDAVLRETPFIAGENFSMADITVFTGLNFSETYPQVMIPSNLTALTEWRSKIAARPSCVFVPDTLKGRP